MIDQKERISGRLQELRDAMLPELEPVQQGMHPRVKLAFKNLRDELLIAMGRDQTSPKDAEIYGHIHAHVFSLEAIYKDILGGR